MQWESIDLDSLQPFSSAPVLGNREDTPETETHDLSLKVVRKNKTPSPPAEDSVASLISSSWYIPIDASVLDIVDDLTMEPSIQALGVVTEQNKVLGIIIRDELFKIVGRPYGRDLLSRQGVRDIFVETKGFDWTENIFTIAEQIQLEKSSNQFFVIQDEQARFIGIFTSWDIMVFLSNLTREDIQLARKIQRGLVKELEYLRDKTFELAYSSLMAKGIGGDYVGIRDVDSATEKRIACLCDVAGKGIAASLISSTLAGILQAFDPAMGFKNFLRFLNKYLFHTFGPEKYITGIFIEIDPVKKILLTCDLGHGHMLLYRKRKIAPFTSPSINPPLGIAESIELRFFSLQLDPDDTFILYSDGLAEQKNMHSATYSPLQLKRFLQEGENLSSVLIRMWEDFHTFRGHSPQTDDATALLIRRIV